MDAGHCGRLDIGGQLRLRYHHEFGTNKAAERFLDTTDDFLLNRFRLYANYEVSDWLRFYVEGIYADSYFETRPPRAIDVNNGDFLHLFVDVKLDDELTVRAGRQQLLYGAQRCPAGLFALLAWPEDSQPSRRRLRLRPVDVEFLWHSENSPLRVMITAEMRTD